MLISKVKKLIQEKKYKELTKQITDYISYIFKEIWFCFSLKEMHPDLKKTKKHWIFYTCFKSKYRSYLKNYKTYHNEKHEYSDYVWWCWFQGEENAPEIVKKCLASVRKHFAGKKIVIITEQNMFDYVTFPEFIIQKYKKGIISRTHLSDLLRLELLINYGGTWIDSTCFCSNTPDYIFNKPLFVFKAKEKHEPGVCCQSWFMSSEKNEPILTLTRDLFYNYWQKNNKLIHYFLIYFFMTLASEKYEKEWKDVPWYPDLNCFILEREIFDKYSDERFREIKKWSDIHKLSYKFNVPENISNTFYEKIMEGK